VTAPTGQAPDPATSRAATRFARLGITACLLLTTGYHISLLGRGALAWPDEHLYRDALSAVEALGRGSAPDFARSITGFGARPAEALFRLPPALLQKVVEGAWELPAFSPASLRVATAPNVLTSLLLSIVFYRVTRDVFLTPPPAAAMGAAAYALLAGNHVWVRHVVPYDLALAVDLLALALVLRIDVARLPAEPLRQLLGSGLLVAVSGVAYLLAFFRSRTLALPFSLLCLGVLVVMVVRKAKRSGGGVERHCLEAGAISGIGLALYPAYYSFGAALAGMLLLAGRNGRALGLSLSGLRAAWLFLLAKLAVIFTFETLARVGDVSYLGTALRLSRTITQGSFEEGLIFLPKYLAVVEGPAGVILLGLGLGGAWRWVAQGNKPRPLGEARLVRSCFVVAVLYLVYGIQSTLLLRMTFTGRYLRMYIPFVVWAAVGMIAAVGSVHLRRMAMIALGGAAAVSFGVFVAEYSRIDYPADVLFRQGIGYEDLVASNIVAEADLMPNYTLPVKAVTAGSAYVTHPRDERYVIVNFGIFSLDGHHLGEYVPPAAATLVCQVQHFLTFRTSVFESYAIPKRRELREHAYQLKVFRLE
jgi:hypothetical protein